MSGFAAEFLGCKVSMTDAQEIRERLTEAGHAEVDPERARVRVVNTCCVTAEAVAKSRKAVRAAGPRRSRTWSRGGLAIWDAPARRWPSRAPGPT